MPIAIPTLDAAGQAGPSGSEKVKADYWDSVISQPAEWGFAAHTAELENLQRGLVDDVEELIAQEGYDVAVQAGLREWVADRGMVHRALRRHRYDLAKTHAALLHTIAYRITHSLHLPIPPYPSSFSTDASHHHLPSSSTSLAPSHPDPASADVQDIPAYTILPVPTFHTRSNQPIALITLQHVQRDDDGSLDGLKEWVRWGMEMTRRALRDWDACRGAVGRGGLIGHFGSDGVSGMKGGEPEGHVRRPDGDGEGLKATSADKNEGGDEGVGRCVLVVDAACAGYRNLEVEILPTLLSTAQTHFPALYSSVLIVNAGWAQRSMWSVVRRLLPRSAAERVRFLDVGDGGALGEWFNSDALPVSLGGTVPYALSSTTDHTQLRYAHHASYHPTPYPLPPSSALDRQSVSGSGSATSCLAQNASTPPIFRCGTTPHVPPNSQEGGGNGDEGIWRTVSCSSISDLFYTAPGSPVVSVQGSRRNSLGRGTGLGDGDVVDAAAAEGGATPRAGELSGLGGVRGSALSRKLQHLHGLQMTRTRSDPNANSSRPYRDSEEPSEMDSNQSQQIQADSQQTGSPLTAVPLATPTSVETGLVPTDEMGGGELRRRRSYGSIHRARDPMGVTDKYGHGYEHEHSQDRAGRAEGQGQASPVLASSSFVAGLDQLVPRSSLSSAHSGPGVFKPLPAIATVKGKSNSRLASLARLMPLSTTNAPGSKPTSPNMSPIQRIKSLSDFHLYLSPSRLANIDLLSDSESESDPDEGNGRVRDDVMVARCPRSGRAGLGNAAGALDDVETKYPTARRTPSGGMPVETSGIASIPPASDTPVRSPNHPRRPALASTPTRRTLHPLILDPTETDRLHASLSLAHRRARPGLRIHGVESDLSQPGSRLTGGEQMSGGMPGGGARTYSGQMGLHHVAVLRTYQRGSPLRGVWGGAEQILGGHGGSGTGGIVDAGPGTSTSPPDDSGTYPNAPSNPDLSGCDTNTTQSTPNPAPSNIDQTHAISAYSKSLNPWYGYPALLTRTPTGSVSLVPRYARRRHRDLFKTLLFLAMLRLQNIRDSAERMLGLRALGGVPWGRLRGRYLDRDWAFGFAGAKVDESVRTASTGIGGSGQEGGDGERGRSNRVRDTGEGEVVGPAEGLERVEREQHRRRLLSGISIDPASGHSQYETRPAYTQPGQGSRVERNLATAPADKYLRLARYLVLSLLPASTYSAEWVWAIVGLVLFRGAWVRVMYRVLGAVGWLRVMVGMGVHKVGFGGR